MVGTPDWLRVLLEEREERFRKEDELWRTAIRSGNRDRRRNHLRSLFYARYANSLQGKIDYATRRYRFSVREKWNDIRWRIVRLIAGDLIDD